MLEPVDGADLTPLLEKEIGPRDKPIGFRYGSKKAFVDKEWKIVQGSGKEEFALYNLDEDPSESMDLREQHPEIYKRLVDQYTEWSTSVDDSVAGKDYPEGHVKDTPKPIRWTEHPKFKHLQKELN
jgi:arylsulfatase A-like enzyme